MSEIRVLLPGAKGLGRSLVLLLVEGSTQLSVISSRNFKRCGPVSQPVSGLVLWTL